MSSAYDRDDSFTAESEDAEQRSGGLRSRIANQAEDAIGRLADDLLENPVINSALQGAFSAREKVGQAQQSAMEALNLPTASDLDKLARRLRSMSQRLEDVEDGVDRLGSKLEAMMEANRAPMARLNEQLDRLEARVDRLAQEVAGLRAEAASGGGVTGEPPAVIG
jgi:polyhydroxyalkanoate synthesis regulator phasin